MGIYIKIHKVLEENKTGYYKVHTKDFGGADFYIGIDKKKQLIKFYITENFSTPIKVIDYSKKNLPIGELSGIDIGIFTRVLTQSIKALKMNIFPDYLSYEA